MTNEFPVYTRTGPAIESGEGCWLNGADGKRYLDLYGGHAVAALGHRHPELTRAIAGQADRLLFQTNAVDLAVRTQACRALTKISPAGVDRVLLLNSGAEANENALRLAFWRTGRTKVVALEGGFHGRTAAAAAVTDHTPWYGFPRSPFDVERVPANDISALDGALTEDTAAFMFEPVQGLAGARDLDPDFVLKARKLCLDRGVVMIADEVQTGMGRTGDFFAVQGLGITPDLMTTAKGIAGGFPAAALFAPAAVADEIPKGWMGTTFGGGPAACAAISATVEAISQPGFLANVKRAGNRIQAEAKIGPVEKITGRGLLLGLHCRRPAKEVLADLLQAGILAGDAKDPNVVRLLPPLTLGDGEIDLLLDCLGGMAK